MFIVSFRKKWESTKSIRGELNNIGYTTASGKRITPFKTKKNPPECNKPLISWNL